MQHSIDFFRPHTDAHRGGFGGVWGTGGHLFISITSVIFLFFFFIIASVEDEFTDKPLLFEWNWLYSLTFLVVPALGLGGEWFSRRHWAASLTSAQEKTVEWFEELPGDVQAEFGGRKMFIADIAKMDDSQCREIRIELSKLSAAVNEKAHLEAARPEVFNHLIETARQQREIMSEVVNHYRDALELE